jgi:hypothetical protein
MKRVVLALLVLVSLCVLASCGTLEVGIERIPEPPAPTTTRVLTQEAVVTATRTTARSMPTPAPSPTPTNASANPTSPWGDLPPGLVYQLSGMLWAVDAQGKPVQVAGNADAILSPDGSSLISSTSPIKTRGCSIGGPVLATI